eukprot:c28476_g1_i2 orf=636-2729(-)
MTVQCVLKFTLQTCSALSVSSKLFYMPGERKHIVRSSLGPEWNVGIGGMKWIHVLAGGSRVYSEKQRKGVRKKQTIQVEKRRRSTSEFHKLLSGSSSETIMKDVQGEAVVDTRYYTGRGGLSNVAKSYSGREKSSMGGSRKAALLSGVLEREKRFYHSVVNDDDVEERSESDDDVEEMGYNAGNTSKGKAGSKQDDLYSAAKRPRSDTQETSQLSEDMDSGTSHLTQTRFDTYSISPLSIKSLHTLFKYERMTAVQEATLPVILQGKDVLAKARTGTGKTIAFLLPAIEMILKAQSKHENIRNRIYALAVCPTRELAQQACTEARTLLHFHGGMNAQVVIGGNNIRNEQRTFQSEPCQILVGTPGRLVDHIERTEGFMEKLRSVEMFILDEADHMLDMGFRKSLDRILSALRSKHQTLMFSATIPQEVHSISKIALKEDHLYIDVVGEDRQDTHAEVEQHCIVAKTEMHFSVVYSVLQKHIKVEPKYKVLVFCTTARVTAFMAQLYQDLGFNTREIHSRKSQQYRTRISDEFRKAEGAIILFTSDVSARGVDYPNVTLVIQIGSPSDRNQYIHRLGRTGRAGKPGEGLLLLAPWEDSFLEKVQDLSVRRLRTPPLDANVESKIRLTASRIESRIRTQAYQAWIGYYKSQKDVGLDRESLVHHANEFSFSMGFEQPPLLSSALISKLNLKGVAGIRSC